MSIKKVLKKVSGNNKYLRYLYDRFMTAGNATLVEKRKNFYAQFLSKDDLFFDVGANYGNRIKPVLLLDSSIKVVAVEPQEECANYLKLRYGNKITVINKGLGAKEEEKTMFISDMHVLSSFSREWIASTSESGKFGDIHWNEKRTIPMTTLDSLINKFGVPQFIKIDVEGYELEVLKGLTKSVKTVSFEYTVPEQTDRAIQCLQRLASISGSNIVSNYSIGESMEWALNEWVSPEKMVAELQTERFNKSGFGDIYVRYI